MNSEILTKYLDGTASPEEKAMVNTWLADEQSDMSLYYSLLDQDWAQFNTTEQIPEADNVRILGNIRTGIQQSQKAPLKKTSTFVLVRRAVNMAACIALIVWAGFAVKRNADKKQVDSTLAELSWEMIENDSYNSRRITMPDSTIIVLSGRGSISYNNGYNISNRSIRLSGEAYFDVQTLEALPFEVNTKNVTTKVLGTCFNIEAYHDEPTIRISLVKGKVAVHMNTGANNDTMLLSPGHTLCYNALSNTRDIQPIALKDCSGWGKGNLLFNNVPLTEVLKRIADRYNLKITCKDTGIRLEDKRVTAVFRNETTEEILRSLLFVHGLKLEQKDHTNFVITR